MITIVIVDHDTSFVYDLLRVFFTQQEMNVVGVAATAQSGLDLIAQMQPLIALVNAELPDRDGIELTADVMKKYPMTAVIIMAAQAESEMLRQAMLAGARDFIDKSAKAAGWLQSIQNTAGYMAKLATQSQSMPHSTSETGSAPPPEEIVAPQEKPEKSAFPGFLAKDTQELLAAKPDAEKSKQEEPAVGSAAADDDPTQQVDAVVTSSSDSSSWFGEEPPRSEEDTMILDAGQDAASSVPDAAIDDDMPDWLREEIPGEPPTDDSAPPSPSPEPVLTQEAQSPPAPPPPPQDAKPDLDDGFGDEALDDDALAGLVADEAEALLDLADSTPDEIPDWMESLAARQGASGEDGGSAPDDFVRDAEPPPSGMVGSEVSDGVEDQEALTAADEDETDSEPAQPRRRAGGSLLGRIDRRVSSDDAAPSKKREQAAPSQPAAESPSPTTDPAALTRAGSANFGSMEEIVKEARAVHFSAYHPREVQPDDWQPMLAYVYRQLAADKIGDDAQRQIGEKLRAFRRIGQVTSREVKAGAPITATPQLPGFQFNPPSVTVYFYENWHRFDFKMRAADAPKFQAANGFITFTVEGVIVADIPLSVFVGETTDVSQTVSLQTRIYEAVFASYSHDDTHIVERVEAAYKALGLDYLRDVTTLKAGQHWDDELLEMIDQADIFQLFWSPTAAGSHYVQKEWEYALRLDRDDEGFIRPVYWSQPIAPVPRQLSHIHFTYRPELSK